MKKEELLKILKSPVFIAIIACILLIGVAIYMFLTPEKKLTPSGIEIAEIEVKADEELSKDNAIKLAIEQFKILGEKNLKEADLEVLEIIKQNEDYYFISSKNNTVEIKKLGGMVTMINSATVTE